MYSFHVPYVLMWFWCHLVGWFNLIYLVLVHWSSNFWLILHLQCNLFIVFLLLIFLSLDDIGLLFCLKKMPKKAYMLIFPSKVVYIMSRDVIDVQSYTSRGHLFQQHLHFYLTIAQWRKQSILSGALGRMTWYKP